MPGRVQEKVAIVTGGAHGMGAAAAILFAKEGAKVCIMDIRKELADSILQQIKDIGGEAIFQQGDVTNERDWIKTIAATIEAFGKVNILVNNAGIGPSQLDPANVDDWRTFLDVNATSAFVGTKLCAKKMCEAGGGAIVNIGSIAAFVGLGEVNPAYGASKGALLSYTKQCACIYGKDNIRVNSVHPGLMPRMLQVDGRPQLPAEIAYKDRLPLIPLGRIGVAEEVAYGVLFLASDEASYITGSDLVIDGGYLAR